MSKLGLSAVILSFVWLTLAAIHSAPTSASEEDAQDPQMTMQQLAPAHANPAIEASMEHPED